MFDNSDSIIKLYPSNTSMTGSSDAKIIQNPINKYGTIQYIGITKIKEKYNALTNPTNIFNIESFSLSMR